MTGVQTCALPIWTPEEQEALSRLETEGAANCLEKLGKGFRLLPYQAVGVRSGLLLCFRPDSASLDGRPLGHTAYEVEQAGALADLSQYLSQEDLERYVDSYIEEGRIAADGTLRIFPVAKSTEIMMINKTDWEPFAADTGASLDDLSTIEGVASTAQAYYEWTDGLTPDVPGDGKALYGRDAVANYFIIGMQQLGVEIFQVENGRSEERRVGKECGS